MKSAIRSILVVAAATLAVGGCKNNNGAKNDGGGGTGGSGGGSASGLVMTMTGLPGTMMPSTAASLHLAITNPDGSAATSYTGSVAFTSTDAAGVLPPTYTFTAADGGGHDFMVALNTAGVQTITATDTTDSGLNAHEDTMVVAGPAYYYVPPTSGKIQLLPDLTQSTPTLAVLNLTAMVDLTGYYVGFDVVTDVSKLAPDASLITAGTVLNPGTAPAAIAASFPTAGPLPGALATGISQKATGNGAVATDATIPAGSVFYTIKLPLKAGAAGGTIMDGTVAKNVIRAGLRNKVGTEVVGVADFGIGKLVWAP
jgi:hypothetical protein